VGPAPNRGQILAIGLLLGNADLRLVPPRDGPQGFLRRLL